MSPQQKTVKQPIPILLIFLTVVMIVISKLFYIHDYIAVPQFAHFDHWTYSIEQIKMHHKSFWFFSFFVVDTFWAIFLLKFVYGYLRNNVVIPDGVSTQWRTYWENGKIFTIVMVWTWSLDVLENTLYLVYFFHEVIPAPLMRGIVTLKELSYAIVLVAFLFLWIKRNVSQHFTLFAKSLSVSIFFLLMIALLLTNMEQGASLIIALLSSPGDLLVTFVLLYLLSTIFSHYPNYMKAWADKHDVVYWKKHSGFFKGGLITYHQYQDCNKISIETPQIEKEFHTYRYFTGAMIYVAMIYALVFTWEKYIFPMDGFYTAFIFLIILMVLLYHKIRKENPTEETKTLDAKAYFILYHLSLVLMVVSFILSIFCQWSAWTFGVVLLVLIIKTILRFFNLDKTTFDDNLHLSLVPFVLNFEKHFMTQTIRKLMVIKFSGFIIVAALIALHHPYFAMKVNPINIILAYIHLFYGAIIITVKYYLYGKEQKCNHEPQTGLPLTIYKNIGYLIVLLLLIKKFGFNPSNDHQHLETVPYQQETLSLDTYMNQYHKHGQRNYLASWGGGLRATYFNLLLLKSLQKKSNGDFLNHTVAMSGVSGGMLGLGFYFGITKENQPQMDQIIDEIGNGNFASSDIVYLLGHDRLPIFKKCIKDRSITGITNYWNIISKDGSRLPQVSYQSYWSQYVSKKPFPMLLTNTAQTNGKYGIACTATLPFFDSVFVHATNIIDNVGNQTLPYYQTLSTSERFPFFSATATIDGIGHFIDGGYYENSGLQSLTSLRNYINQNIKHSPSRKDSIFIVLNSKESMLSYLFASDPKLSNLKPKIKIEAETDYSAIINGILSVDVHANFLTMTYFKNTLKDPSFETKVYYLPYTLRYNDFVSYLGGEPDAATSEAILAFIQEHNTKIETCSGLKAHSKWYYAYPTLSRMLSEPTVRYYQAVMQCL